MSVKSVPAYITSTSQSLNYLAGFTCSLGFHDGTLIKVKGLLFNGLLFYLVKIHETE